MTLEKATGMLALQAERWWISPETWTGSEETRGKTCNGDLLEYQWHKQQMDPLEVTFTFTKGNLQTKTSIVH